MAAVIGEKDYQLVRLGQLMLMLCATLIISCGAHAVPPADRVAVLARGINITHWFRFPPDARPEALGRYLSGTALRELRNAGFSFVRIPVQPELLLGSPAVAVALGTAVRQAEQSGLAVIVAVAPTTWHLESSAADREALIAAWQILGRAMRPLPVRLTFPELLNEPVFPDAAAGWWALQERVRVVVRTALPNATIVLTGHDWGSVRGLIELRPAPDGNVIYSVHFYDPSELTSLAAWKPGLNRGALARLPFPVVDGEACEAGVAGVEPTTAGVWRFYCAQGWNEAAIAQRINQAAEWGRRNHAVVLLGEFGASAMLNRAARLAWLGSVRRTSEANGMGWALWGYDDVMGFSVPMRRRNESPVLDSGVLAALGLQRGH
jgi:endoglucanase